jgi:hypothetical protein
MRLSLAAAMGLLATAALAAPVPKETEAEKIRRLFGKVVDSDKDCTLSLDGSVLRIRVPDRPHVLTPQRGVLNAPRTIREVEGDFTATVKIRILKPSSVDQPPSRFQAGLVILGDSTTLVHHSRQLDTIQSPPRLSGIHALILNGRQTRSGGSGGGIFTAETATFRITRSREKVRLAASSDGKTWHNMPEFAVPLPDKVAVGVYAAQAGTSAFTAEFEDFVLVKTAPGKP